MMRSKVLLIALLGACVVGEKPDTGGGSNNPGTGDKEACEPKAATIPTAHPHTASGANPAGPRGRAGCMDTGCHAQGGASTHFAFAGTVYKETAAVSPAAGVTIRIFKPGNPQSLAEAVTDNAGNFVIRTPAMFQDFPYETHVTACGNSVEIRPMIAQISATDANCNLGGGCHGATGLQGAVYLAD